MTSRGADLTRRRADERVDVVVDDDFIRSVSLLHALDELRPRVVVFESMRVASSAMITTLALGSTQRERAMNEREHEVSSIQIIFLPVEKLIGR